MDLGIKKNNLASMPAPVLLFFYFLKDCLSLFFFYVLGEK